LFSDDNGVQEIVFGPPREYDYPSEVPNVTIDESEYSIHTPPDINHEIESDWYEEQPITIPARTTFELNSDDEEEHDIININSDSEDADVDDVPEMDTRNIFSDDNVVIAGVTSKTVLKK